MAPVTAPVREDQLEIVPANEASWDDVRRPLRDHHQRAGGYLDGEPVGWVAVEPRTSYPKLRTTRVPWSGRDEDKDDEGVRAVTCLVVRKGYRGRGLTYALARATVDHARGRGARALEAYPMIIQPGKEVTWGELNVGARQVFADAGFTEVSHPTLRRVVMRIDFR